MSNRDYVMLCYDVGFLCYVMLCYLASYNTSWICITPLLSERGSTGISLMLCHTMPKTGRIVRQNTFFKT